MFNSENVQKKWAPILEHADLPSIQDNYKRSVTAVLLENQEKALREERSAMGFQSLTETAANATGAGVAGWDPVLISLVRRSMPNLMAYDIAGVQPMSAPTGLIFAMKSRYTSQSGTEALFGEANSAFSGAGTQVGGSDSLGSYGKIGRAHV